MIYDLAGGNFAERSWRCTAHGGRSLAVGFADDDNNGMTAVSSNQRSARGRELQALR